MAMKADAWKEYRKAAKLQMWMEALPTIAAEVAAPLSQTNKVTMVGFSGMQKKLKLHKIKRNWKYMNCAQCVVQNGAYIYIDYACDFFSQRKI